MKIENTTKDDLQKVLELYDLAIDLQKIKFPECFWPKFDIDLIKNDIAEKRQWKIMVDGEIGCIWTITFSDPQIWEEKNVDPSIYIHRIAINPKFKGQKFVPQIVNWAKEFATQQQKEFIRMDTCGKNYGLVRYYTSCGFDFLGMKKLKNTDGLPAHYTDIEVCFFEMNLKQNALFDKDNITISTDKSLLDTEYITDYLINESYWASHRTKAEIQKSIDNSLCFGMYEKGKQIGFARVITDKVVFSYIMDVFIDEAVRGKGYGKHFFKKIYVHEALLEVESHYLLTKDAQEFYKKLGFKTYFFPERFMLKTSK